MLFKVEAGLAHLVFGPEKWLGATRTSRAPMGPAKAGTHGACTVNDGCATRLLPP